MFTLLAASLAFAAYQIAMLYRDTRPAPEPAETPAPAPRPTPVRPSKPRRPDYRWVADRDYDQLVDLAFYTQDRLDLTRPGTDAAAADIALARVLQAEISYRNGFRDADPLGLNRS